MKNLFVLFFLITSSLCFAQKPITFDSIAVVSTKDTIRIKCKTTIIYSEKGFTIVSEDARVYSYLLPGIEFTTPQAICFYDIREQLDDQEADCEGPVLIYQSTFKETQVAQYVRHESITLMKKDKSGISFF